MNAPEKLSNRKGEVYYTFQTFLKLKFVFDIQKCVKAQGKACYIL